jgi:hypothetical protein
MLEVRKGWQENGQEEANGKDGIKLLLCVDWYMVMDVSVELRTSVSRDI